MKDSSRATIAYIAGRVINNSKSSSVYDYSKSKHINISGEINTKQVNVYNYEKGCHFSGNRSRSNYSIYNYGDGCHIRN